MAHSPFEGSCACYRGAASETRGAARRSRNLARLLDRAARPGYEGRAQEIQTAVTIQKACLDAACDVARLLRFYSRLPVPALPWEHDPGALPDFTRAPRLLPVAGALIGGIGAAVFALAQGLGAPIAAILAITALVTVTGAFHEDGLADTADGFWGGATVERRLAIMKDSRIGSYGGAALILSLMLRVAALAALAVKGGTTAACAAIVVAAAWSRVCGLLPLVLLDPARREGAGAAAGRPSGTTLVQALAIAAGLAMLLAALAGLPMLALPALAGGLLLAGITTHIAYRKIGGQTGDVAGAAQQVAEIGVLLALVAGG